MSLQTPTTFSTPQWFNPFWVHLRVHVLFHTSTNWWFINNIWSIWETGLIDRFFAFWVWLLHTLLLVEETWIASTLLARPRHEPPAILSCTPGLAFLAATKQLYEWYFLSVCPSVCPSVRLSHLFDYVPIIVSSWNFQELSHWTRVRSMQKVKVRGQRSRSQRSRPKFSFPDCNSSLNSHMMMKWYIQLDVA